eukprot:GILI01004925.1.p1 GENE.GILI01004925.1~~GILI01004925.1.p1  ORF type:complete len:113 (+),score=20.84 GILI01004925.1:128-466(+)
MTLNEVTSFVSMQEPASSIANQAISNQLGQVEYDPKEVQSWTNAISENIVRSLQNANPNFKYIVSCVIMEKKGAGLHTSTQCYWDNESDGCCSVRWENKGMHCIVTVFGLAL